MNKFIINIKKYWSIGVLEDKMENKKVIIIGGGIAGLSAGCYLQMNNYDTEIFELHNIPGGKCSKINY